MEVLGSGYMSPCSDFSQSFQSVRQTASDTCSPYSNLNCIQQNSPANQFSSPQLVSESQRISPLSNPFTSSNGEACTEGGTVFSTVKQEGHTCDVCNKVFSERSLLQKHKVAHADAKHICPTCGRAFVREDKLRRHIRSIHSDERPFVCEVCSKAFARKDKLQEHARHHNRDITFPCPACNEVFLMRSLLNRHLRLTHQMKSADSQNSTKTSQSTNSDTTTPSSSSRKRSKRQANNNVGSAAVSEASNNTGKVSAAEKLSSDLSYSSQQQQQPDHVGWNAANLLLYNRYQQQQAQQAQMEMPWGSSSGNAATSGYLYNPSQAAAAAAYQFPSQYAAAAMMRHARPSESQQQQQTQQQQPRQVPESTGTTQQQYSAFSAAMAARLFSPSNYANWWQQAGPKFMFPQTQLSRAAGTSATATNAACYSGETQSAMTAVTTATTTPASGFPSSSSSSSASYSAAAAAASGSQALAFQPPNFSSVPTTANSSAPASLVELSSVSGGYNMPSVDVRPGMLASLPSFAQAVYYRAASLAASQGASSQAQSGQHLHQQTQQQHPASAFAPPAAYPP